MISSNRRVPTCLPFALPPADDGLAAFFPTFSIGILQKRRRIDFTSNNLHACAKETWIDKYLNNLFHVHLSLSTGELSAPPRRHSVKCHQRDE